MIRQLLESANIQVINNYIYIPEEIKHIKLDIGLSYNAPMTQRWLSTESELVVFAFEPNPESVASILSLTNKKREPYHGDVLDYKYIHGKRAHIVPVAVGKDESESIDFYITQRDVGCSSLYKPKTECHAVEKTIKVPVIKLSSFFKLFPFHQFPIIEYIKIDAQGSDFDILLGAEEYLKNHVVYVTVETDGDQYEGAELDNPGVVYNYMVSQGFERVHHPNTSDSTYLNSKFKEHSGVFIFQRG
jgi:FkbM family methyltransferase